MTDTVHIVCPGCNTTNRLSRVKLSQSPICGKCKKPLFFGAPTSINQALFETYIHNNDIPVLVDFWASWCGPCQAMAPHFEAASKMLEPEVRLVKINTETAQELAAKYRIQSIPTLLLFKNGQEAARVSGLMRSQELVNWVKAHS